MFVKSTPFQQVCQLLLSLIVVERTYKLGHLGSVISISIVGTADNDSGEEPVFSVTIYASFARCDEIN